MWILRMYLRRLGRKRGQEELRRVTKTKVGPVSSLVSRDLVRAIAQEGDNIP